MSQEIITYTILIIATGIAFFKLYQSVFAAKKSSSCGNCGCGKKNCTTT